MGNATRSLQKIRTIHARSQEEHAELMKLLANRTKEDIKDGINLKEVIEMYMNMNMKDKKGILIKLKEVVDAWQEKMKNKKGKKSGTAEGQEKKDKKRTRKGPEKDQNAVVV
jgi:hypothetical protein